MQVRFGDDHRTRFAKLANLECIDRRRKTKQSDRPGRGRHVLGGVVILHDHRNPVERTPRPFFRPLLIQSFSLLDRIRIDRDNRVQPRTLRGRKLRYASDKPEPKPSMSLALRSSPFADRQSRLPATSNVCACAPCRNSAEKRTTRRAFIPKILPSGYLYDECSAHRIVFSS